MRDHLDLDEEPSEMEDIDEGFDCVPAKSFGWQKEKDRKMKEEKEKDFFYQSGKNQHASEKKKENSTQREFSYESSAPKVK